MDSYSQATHTRTISPKHQNQNPPHQRLDAPHALLQTGIPKVVPGPGVPAPGPIAPTIVPHRDQGEEGGAPDGGEGDGVGVGGGLHSAAEAGEVVSRRCVLEPGGAVLREEGDVAVVVVVGVRSVRWFVGGLGGVVMGLDEIIHFFRTYGHIYTQERPFLCFLPLRVCVDPGHDLAHIAEVDGGVLELEVAAQGNEEAGVSVPVFLLLLGCRCALKWRRGLVD